MKSRVLHGMMLLSLVCLGGCAPVDSLFALYTKDDTFFDQNLIGEWRQVSPSDSESTNNRWVFLHDGDSPSFAASVVSLEKRGAFLAKGHLVPLGNALFVDFEPDTSVFDHGDMPMPYPFIESHFIGRIWIDKDTIRIHFLNDDWVKKQLKEGKLTLAHAGSGDNPVLNAPTADLRRFSREHAEDDEAFSENYELARVK